MNSFVLNAWLALAPFHEFLSSLALTVFSGLLFWAFRAKVKVIWGSASATYHQFSLPPERGGGLAAIWTEKLYLQNTGRKPAVNVEIVLTAPPSSYALWQVRDHSAKVLSGGQFSLVIPSLAPQELLVVDVIDIDSRNVRVLAVNCPDALTQSVSFLPQRQFGHLVNGVVGYLLVAGVIGTVYAAIRIAIGGTI